MLDYTFFSPALTGGYTGKAKSCIGAWVPTVSIHKPLCLKKKFMLNVYKKLNVFCGAKRGETVRERDGRQREGKTEPKGRGEQGGEGRQQ
jgi:hypothetical protein